MLLRHRSDLPSVACVITSVSCQAAWLATGKLAYLVPMFAALRWTALVQHNHSHLSIFKKGPGNRLLDLALGTVTGMPMELYREAHTRTHHPYTGTSKDWTQPAELHDRQALRDKPISRWRYLYVFGPRGWALGWQAIRQDRTLTRRLAGECAVMAAVLVFPFLAGSPLRVLVLVALWALVAVVSADANYKHHDGYLDDPQPEKFANDSLSILYTRLGFNIGYHTAHHGRPSAHWSKLPELSARAPSSRSRQAA